MHTADDTAHYLFSLT